jgi:hypothetical protein
MSRPDTRSTPENGAAAVPLRCSSMMLGLLVAVCVTFAVVATVATPAHAAFGVSVFDGGTFGPPPPDHS